MKITKDTMRADGLTVGQAMEQDAAFLESIGLPVVAQFETEDEKLEAHIEKVRQAVLNALDEASPNGLNGWQDQDLPDLFKAIDRQAKIQFERHNTPQKGK